MKALTQLLASVTLVLVSLPGSAIVLDFDPATACGAPCSNRDFIDQGYGDTSSVDVQWGTNTRHWETGFSTLENVGYHSDGTPNSGPFVVDLVALGASTVTLNSFDLGSWTNAGTATSLWTISEIGGSVLATSGSIFLNGVMNVSGTWSSSTGISISIGPDANNVAIDNINFTVSAVPAPAPLGLMALGLLGIGVRRRR